MALVQPVHDVLCGEQNLLVEDRRFDGIIYGADDFSLRKPLCCISSSMQGAEP